MPQHRVALVTGAARGIGLACARRFAEDGLNVALCDVDEDAGASARDEVAMKGEAIFVRADVSDRLDVRNLLAETLSAFGRIDVLVNNAGIIAPGDILSLEEDDFDQVLRTNLRGAFLVAQAVARRMVAQIDEAEDRADDARRRYAIINMSSVNSVTAMPDQLAYNVSKGGLNQLTRAMALALAPHGIRVNAVAPGSVNTDVLRSVLSDADKVTAMLSRTPLGRIADPDEIAAVASFLASADASYVTGEILYADGGRLALNMLAKGAEE